MSVRLYLHTEGHGLHGTFPTGAQDPQTPSFQATNASTVRLANTEIGTAVVNLQATTAASASEQAGFMGMFSSYALDGDQTVGGVGQTLTVNVADYESSLNCNFCVNRIHAYVWRPSTGVKIGSLVSYADAPSSGSPSEPTAAASIQVTTFVVDLAEVSALDGDVVMFELWGKFTQDDATGYTVRMYYDGTTVNTVENTVVSSHASFVELSQNLLFRGAEARVSYQSAVVWADPTAAAVEARVSYQSVIAWVIPEQNKARVTAIMLDVLSTDDDNTNRPRTFVSM